MSHLTDNPELNEAFEALEALKDAEGNVTVPDTSDTAVLEALEAMGELEIVERDPATNRPIKVRLVEDEGEDHEGKAPSAVAAKDTTFANDEE